MSLDRATAIYTDDSQLISFAELNNLTCIRVADLPIPASARQAQLPFENDNTSETAGDAPEAEDNTA
jgi:hypothetical protein